ncbi:hypothetical protein FPOAC2_08778 [Fusarium poae]|jgi:hypothetical protein
MKVWPISNFAFNHFSNHLIIIISIRDIFFSGAPCDIIPNSVVPSTATMYFRIDPDFQLEGCRDAGVGHAFGLAGGGQPPSDVPEPYDTYRCYHWPKSEE